MWQVRCQNDLRPATLDLALAPRHLVYLFPRLLQYMKPSSRSRKPSPSRWPLILIAAGAVLLVVVAALALAPPVSAPAPTPTLPAVAAPSASDIPRATVAEAKAAYDDGSAVFLDVRDAGSYEIGHITGAESIPLVELEENLGKLDKAKWIITYCT